MRAVRVRVGGVVQGVGFRYATVRQARALELDGWVRNRLDGTVESWAQGPPATVETFLEFLRAGPVGAHVATVDIADEDPDPRLRGFDIRF